MPRETWKLALRGIQRGLQQTRRENDDRRGREALMRRGIGETRSTSSFIDSFTIPSRPLALVHPAHAREAARESEPLCSDNLFNTCEENRSRGIINRDELTLRLRNKN